MNSSPSAIMKACFFMLDASQEGFDWNSPFEAAAKVKEELEEVIEKLHKPHTPLRHQALNEEIGDLFLACACLTRHCNVEPDEAIALGLKKFKKRYMLFKSYAKEKGISLHEASAAELATIWQLVKQESSQEKLKFKKIIFIHNLICLIAYLKCHMERLFLIKGEKK